jgi:hypothetical protein
MPVSNSIDHLFEVNPKEMSASVNILDESVTSGEPKSYKVFCTVEASFIGIALMNIRDVKFAGLETYHFPKPASAEQLSAKISSLSEQSSILKNVTFNKASIQVAHSFYTLIPSALFRKDDATKFFHFNQKAQRNSTIESEAVKAYDSVNVFSVDAGIASSLKKIFNTDFVIHHHITSLLQAVRLEPGKDKTLYVHFRAGWIEVIITDGKKLVLCNSFPYKAVEDVVYFILNACEQLSLNPHSVDVVVMGELDEESAISKLMHKYIANIRFSGRMKSAQFSYGFDKIPSHFYYSVFSHALCEL